MVVHLVFISDKSTTDQGLSNIAQGIKRCKNLKNLALKFSSSR